MAHSVSEGKVGKTGQGNAGEDPFSVQISAGANEGPRIHQETEHEHPEQPKPSERIREDCRPGHFLQRLSNIRGKTEFRHKSNDEV